MSAGGAAAMLPGESTERTARSEPAVVMAGAVRFVAARVRIAVSDPFGYENAFDVVIENEEGQYGPWHEPPAVADSWVTVHDPDSRSMRSECGMANWVGMRPLGLVRWVPK
jgi:uncharacterized protein YbdZ (MbtH family)